MNADESPKAAGRAPDAWVLGLLAAAALLCAGLLALVLVMVSGKGSLIQVSPVINVAAAAPTPASAPSADTARLPAGAADRDWVRRGLAGILPVFVGRPAPAGPSVAPAAADGIPALTRAAAAPTPSPPPVGPEYVERGDALLLGGGSGVLPMPLRAPEHAVPAPAAPVAPVQPRPAPAAPAPLIRRPAVDQASAAPPAVAAAASPPVSSAPVPDAGAQPQSRPPVVVPAHAALPPPATPAAPAAAVPGPLTAVVAAPATALPPPSKGTATASVPKAVAPGTGPGSYGAAPGSGALAELRLLAASSTATLNGVKADQGTLFFHARVQITNRTDDTLPVSGDAFELADSDGDSYMAGPPADPSAAPGPVPPGAQETMTITFAVPADAALSTLALALPAETETLKLVRR